MNFLSDINKEYYYALHYEKVDRLMVKLLWIHFFVVSLGAFIIYYFRPSDFFKSPFSERALSLTEVSWVAGLGLAVTLLMTALQGRLKNHYVYRILMTNALFFFSYLIVFTTGGSIEGHFHFFVIFALLCVYADWRLGWFGLVVVAAHHAILNVIAPEWVYSYGRNDVSVVAHAIPVLVIVIFTTWISDNARKSVQTISEANKFLETKLRDSIPGLEKEQSAVKV